MLSEDDDNYIKCDIECEGRVSISYPVLVTFETQPVDGGDCVGQMNATEMTIPPGDSPVTFSVDAK